MERKIGTEIYYALKRSKNASLFFKTPPKSGKQFVTAVHVLVIKFPNMKKESEL